MKWIKMALIYAALGGAIFWTPSVALHVGRGDNFRGLDMFILTLLLPLVTVGCFAILWKLRGQQDSRPLIARSMMFGIWALGPLFMSVGWSFFGAGLAKPEGWKLVVIGTLLFPVFTFEMSTYDGTLFALLLMTVLMVIISESSQLKFFKRLRLT
ncbi:MAG: hypothetical protein ABR556_13200 [Pyrinomonadaceae bacterium]